MATTKKVVAKKVIKKVTKPAVDVAALALASTKRATLRMTDADFERLRWEILPKEKVSWQHLLSEAVGDWLEKKKYSRLEDIK